MPIRRVQTLRSSTKGQRPTAGTRDVGELYTNYPDRQIGVIDVARAPQDLVAVRFFSTASDYAPGQYVWQADRLYRARITITAGAFNAANWDAVVDANNLAVILQAADGAGSGFDADLLDGQQGAFYAPINSPTFTGDPQAPTPATLDNDTSVATTAFVKAQSYITAAALVGLAPIASPTFTGDAKAVTPPTADNDTSIATTAHVQANMALKANLAHTHAQADITNLITDLAAKDTAIALKAPLLSPALTGSPTAPTATQGANTTQVATTAFVTNAVAGFDTKFVDAAGDTMTGDLTTSGVLKARDLVLEDAVAGVNVEAPLVHLRRNNTGSMHQLGSYQIEAKLSDGSYVEQAFLLGWCTSDTVGADSGEFYLGHRDGGAFYDDIIGYGAGITYLKFGKLKFPAIQNPSSDNNTLDDCEEGNWTPALRFATASVGMTYSAQSGQYAKIGRLVFYDFDMILTAKGSSVGSATIAGLPFTSTNHVGHGIVTFYSNTLSLTSQPVGHISAAATSMILKHFGAAGSVDILDTNITATTRLQGSGCYLASA